MPTHHVMLWVVCVSLSIGVISCVGPCNNFVWHKPAPAPAPPVAFSMASKIGRSPTVRSIIPLETTIYNDGGFFDTSENVFRAPVNGVYSFMFFGKSGKGKELSFHLYRQKPGQPKVHVARAFDASATLWGGASGALMLKLEAEEMVSLWMNGEPDGRQVLFGSSNAIWGPTTFFSGKLEAELP